jgi:hypothetical protein
MCKVFGYFTGWPSQYMYGGHDEQGLENQSELAVYHCLRSYQPGIGRFSSLLLPFENCSGSAIFDQFLML